MSCNGFNCGFNCSRGSHGHSLLEHMRRYVGETVTIFTTSGGASGCGFTGVILSVNPCFVRLVTEQGLPPTNPLAENVCGEMDNGPERGQGGFCKGRDRMPYRTVGSVCDIPVDRIVAFCHNAV
ncbi:MAG: putative rane protein [Firmicutes bacterium]|nr:putative rane protein [Bacillota bacterium]